MFRGSLYLLAHHNTCDPPAPPSSVHADTFMCVYLSAFSITITSLFESEPGDPLEMIAVHKGEDVTLREGDKNTVSLSLFPSRSQSQVHSHEERVENGSTSSFTTEHTQTHRMGLPLWR